MYGSEVLEVIGGVIHMPGRLIDEVYKTEFNARYLLSALQRADDIPVCINIGLTCIADAHRSQIRSGSHPFICISPHLNERFTSAEDWYLCHDNQSPGNPPIQLPCLAFHEIP